MVSIKLITVITTVIIHTFFLHAVPGHARAHDFQRYAMPSVLIHTQSTGGGGGWRNGAIEPRPHPLQSISITVVWNWG